MLYCKQSALSVTQTGVQEGVGSWGACSQNAAYKFSDRASVIDTLDISI